MLSRKNNTKIEKYVTLTFNIRDTVLELVVLLNKDFMGFGVA